MNSVLSWQLVNSVSLHPLSVWWRQTSWTTVRIPWPGQSTPPAAPCVWCSDPPPAHACVHNVPLQEKKTSLQSVFLFQDICGDWMKSVQSVNGWVRRRTDCVASRPWPVFWIFSRDEFFGCSNKKETEPQFCSSLHAALILFLNLI